MVFSLPADFLHMTYPTSFNNPVIQMKRGSDLRDRLTRVLAARLQ
jgi:hypothetical protein